MIREEMDSKSIPLAYSFNVETPNQLVDIMTERGVYLPMNIGLQQMANIRFIFLTRRLRQIPFDIIKIDDLWFIEKVFHSDLQHFFKQGDRLLIINKTMISDQLQEEDIFKLILHSSIPFIVWVTWDADTYLKYRTLSQQSINENAYIDAKAYLLKTCHYEKISLYDQLAFLIANILRNPQDNMQMIGDRWEYLRWNTHYPTLRSDLRPAKDQSELRLMKIHARLLEGKERELLKSKDYMITAVPHLMEMAYYFSSAGFGLHTTEMILVWTAMKRLNDQINCTEMKFWGKIFGLYCDYYIVQIQHEGEILSDEVDISNQSIHRKQRPMVEKTFQQRVGSQLNEEQNIPIEPHGIGTNQYTYFVTNSPGLPWMKLPDVKPATISQARKIRSFFTGCLSTEIDGFSPYFGLENDYLRAQIARITATTHISPAGYYLLAENEGDEEEPSFTTERKDQYIRRNPEFNNDPTNLITVEFLANTNLQEWVHSLPEILPQGRTQFWRSPSPERTNISNEEEDNEEVADADNIQIPAPLLQPIGDDKLLHANQIPWSIGMTMSVMHEYSLCYVRSNIWPEALTLGHAGNYYNLYVGWGQKYEQFNPSQPPPPEIEYAYEFIEKDDPPVELEEARRAAAAAVEFTSDEEEDYEEPLTDEED